MKPKPGTEVATMFANLAESARAGKITDAFVVVRGEDGTYDDLYYVDDLAEMLLEVGAAKIRARIALNKPQTTEQ